MLLWVIYTVKGAFNMKSEKPEYLKTDSRNRITLTKVTQNPAALYKVYKEGEKIILEPVMEISEEERWIFAPQNKELVEEIKRRIREEKASINWDDIKHKYE